MKVLVSWSSGKDSAWMLHTLRIEGVGAPAALLTTINEAADRVAMHGVRTELLRRQAEAAGLPLVVVNIPSPCPNEVYEERMAAACRAAVADGFTHVAFGDLFLEDVRRYREERLMGTGLVPLFPLWNRPTPALAREMIAGGIEARLTCVDPRAVPAVAGRTGVRRVAAERPARDRRPLRGAWRVPHLRHRRPHVLEAYSDHPRGRRRARRLCLCRPPAVTRREDVVSGLDAEEMNVVMG